MDSSPLKYSLYGYEGRFQMSQLGRVAATHPTVGWRDVSKGLGVIQLFSPADKDRYEFAFPDGNTLILARK